MQAIQNMILAWNTTDAARRAEILSQAVTAEVEYQDPHAPEVIRGREKLNDLVTLLRSRIRHELRLLGPVHQHHGHFYFRWELRLDDHRLSHGIYTGTYTEDGLLSGIVGFIDEFFGMG